MYFQPGARIVWTHQLYVYDIFSCLFVCLFIRRERAVKMIKYKKEQQKQQQTKRRKKIKRQKKIQPSKASDKNRWNERRFKIQEKWSLMLAPSLSLTQTQSWSAGYIKRTYPEHFAFNFMGRNSSFFFTCYTIHKLYTCKLYIQFLIYLSMTLKT